MNKKTLIIIQSRLDSARFRQKAFCDIAGKPLIVRVIERMLSLKGLNYYTVLAVPQDDAYVYNKKLMPIISPGLSSYFILGGDENNVLKRFKQTLNYFNKTKYSSVIRVTGDNPLISRTGLSMLYNQFIKGNYDFGYQKGFPSGTQIEIFKPESLLSIDESELSDYDKEHVTSIFYVTKNKKCIIEAPADLSYPALNLSLDTEADAKFLNQIFSRFDPNEIPKLNDAIKIALEIKGE